MITPPDNSGTEHCDAVVVGGGCSGLMSAAMLAQAGKRVVLVEALDRVGGFQRRLNIEGFQIEPHFHFLMEAGPGKPTRRTLDSLGINLDWIKLDPVARFWFPDRVIDVPTDRAAFIADLQQQFPHEAMGIKRLYRASWELYQAIDNVQEHQAVGAVAPISPALVKCGADTAERFAARFISDPKLAVIVAAWAAYWGYPPHLIGAIPVFGFPESMWDCGLYHPVGGIGVVFDALQQVIARHGGRVMLNAPVREILVERGEVRGVTLQDDWTLKAPIVVSTVDPKGTLGNLVGRSRQSALALRRLGRMDLFRSPFTVLCGVRNDEIGLHDRPAVQIVYPGYDTRSQERALLAGEIERAPMSIGIPTRQNPQLAPDGHGIAMLYTFVSAPQIRDLIADPQFARASAQRIVNLGARAIDGLAENVVVAEPTTIATRSIFSPTTDGALGWAPTPEVMLGGPRRARVLQHPVGAALASGAVRFAPHATSWLLSHGPVPGAASPVPGLYFAGQFTRTGPSIATGFKSAQAVRAKIGFAGSIARPAPTLPAAPPAVEMTAAQPEMVTASRRATDDRI
jgi:phytoene dehydrogenase-like protein